MNASVTQHIYPWKSCICGLLQVSFIYNFDAFSWTTLLIPSILYLFLELAQNLIAMFTQEFLTSTQAVHYLVYLCSLGLYLASLLLFVEAMDSKLDFKPSIIPLFLVFLLHCVCRVLEEPPHFLSPLLHLLSPPLAVCSMTGSCSSFYISVISSFFGAFGSSFIDFFTVLKPLTYVLLFITLLSVYNTRRSLLYIPFIFAFLSCICILAGENLDSLMLITLGNFALVATVIGNNQYLKKNEGKSV